MFLAYSYIKKKRRERERLEKAAQGDQQNTEEASHLPSTNDNGIETHAIKEINNVSEGLGMDGEKTVSTSHPNVNLESRPKESAAEKRARKIHRWKVIFGLFAPFALQALDTTIIAAALPTIARDFDQVKQLNWIISSFNLTSAAFLFFWAQLADIFGRFATIQSAIIVMVIGSAICTGTPTSAFGLLLFGRSLQGVGVAGVGICVRTILADRVSLSEYAITWTIFSLVAGISFGIGPVVGGHLTQVSWRWCFGINIPVGLAALVLVTVLLRKSLVGPEPLSESFVVRRQDEEEVMTREIGRRDRAAVRLATIDYGGQALFLTSVALLLLALTWGGGTYSWKSAAVLVPLTVGAALFAGWITYEYLLSPGHLVALALPRAKAMMPWHIMINRDIGLLFFVNLTTGMAMFAVLYFMDVYFTLVEGKSASSAGNALLYYIPGLGVGAYAAMFFSNVWPRQTFPVLILGGITTAVGVTVLAWASHVRETNLIYGMMALVGFGVSVRMNPGSTHGLAYFPNETARISCLASFALPCGGLIGLTIMTTVFTNKNLNAGNHAQDSIMWAFISIIPFMWIGVVFTALLGNVWISKGDGYEVSRRPYLFGLLPGQNISKEFNTRGQPFTPSVQKEGNTTELKDRELS